MLLEELWRDNPRASRDDLVNPLAVTNSFSSLRLIQHSQSLAIVGLVIARHPDNEVCVWESMLRLLQLSHVTIPTQKSVTVTNTVVTE